MKKNKEVIILVGNIGTGKTTLVSNKYQKRGYVVISRDQLRYSIGNGEYIFNLYYEPVIWATEIFMFREFMDKGINIIVDEVGINKSMRLRYISSIKTFHPEYKIKVIQMPKLDMKEAVDRRMKDPHGQPNRKIWEQVWKKFNKLYEKPTKKEGIDKIVRLK